MSSHEHLGPNEQISKQFDEIAVFYDTLMAGVPYTTWVEYIQRIVKKFCRRPKWVLDLCCGTGSVSILLAKKGYHVVGVDISPGMIAIAREKARMEHVSLDFYVQDVCRLSLERQFDLVISLFDSLNYILNPDDLLEAFHRTAEHMAKDSLLIFDLNTQLALEAGFFDQDNIGSGSPVEYFWRSSYDESSRICTIRMSFDYKTAEGPRHIELNHYQRAYTQNEIVSMLAQSGLTVLATYHGYTFREATGASDRVFYVAAK
ncbi:MAG: class I SAM-dependent methyltransferase [Armatimonadota bacterium]|nr:class I SAM-dependent methyltransferase [Armatimonadota bacterium]